MESSSIITKTNPITQTSLTQAISNVKAKIPAESEPAEVSVQPTQDKEKQATSILKAVDTIKNHLSDKTTLNYELNTDNHRFILKIMDTETNKVIRQIPSEELLRIAKSIEEFTSTNTGTLLKDVI